MSISTVSASKPPTMSTKSAPNAASTTALRNIPLCYNNADSQASALRLIFALFPDWETDPGEIKFTRFTDGITNTLLKATKRRPDQSEADIDQNAVLLRAYGKSTEIIIDREKECVSHNLLAERDLAPPLLARFKNGLMYRFIRGKPCSPEDLRKESVWRGTARRLGEWHALLPVEAAPQSNAPIPTTNGQENGHEEDNGLKPPKSSVGATYHSLEEINAISPGKLTPNIWTVSQKWIFALPDDTPELVERKATLQKELARIVKELSDYPGLGKDGLVMSHCDLLSGNCIIEPRDNLTAQNGNPQGTKPTNGHTLTDDVETVSFIDYEYTTPGPAAFDLANHFSEWGGFDCDHTVLPTKSTRREFLKSYLASYNSHLPVDQKPNIDANFAGKQLTQLCEAVDRFRGIPGFYWGIWGLIQKEISMIDFDYEQYAEDRLEEYWGWRRSVAGEGELSIREKRWAEE